LVYSRAPAAICIVIWPALIIIYSRISNRVGISRIGSAGSVRVVNPNHSVIRVGITGGICQPCSIVAVINCTIAPIVTAYALIRKLLPVSCTVNYTCRACTAGATDRWPVNINSIVIYPDSRWPVHVTYVINSNRPVGKALNLITAWAGIITSVVESVSVTDISSIA